MIESNIFFVIDMYIYFVPFYARKDSFLTSRRCCMLKQKKSLIALLSAALVLCFTAGAGVFAAGDTATSINLGTAAPTAELIAEYGFLSNEDNGLVNDAVVTSIPMTYSSIGVASPVDVRSIGFNWASWSHGFTGHAYYTVGDALTNTLTLPSIVSARLYMLSRMPLTHLISHTPRTASQLLLRLRM
jgi:hypothetical protein